MSDCPSYLGITISDRLQSEELINYDLLVFCPPQFGVTFWLPNWGQRSAKTFDVRLRDSRRTHVVFLTRLLLGAADDRPSTLLTTSTSRDDGADDRELSALFAAVAGVTITLVLLVVTLFVRLRSPCAAAAASRAPSTSAAVVVGAGLKRPRRRRCRVCAYVTVRLVYSVVASFVTVLLTLGVVVRPELDLLAAVEGRLSAAASNDTRWIADVDRAAGDEAMRQVRAATARHSACTRYVDQLYAIAVQRVGFNRSRCVAGGGDGGAATERVDAAVTRYRGVTRSAVDDYRRRVSTTVARLASAQTRQLARLYDNDWAQFAVGLFNLSDVERDRLRDDVAGGTLYRRQVDFVTFFGVDVVHETNIWLDQFWRRYASYRRRRR